MDKKTKGLLCTLICGAISFGIANDAYAEEQEFDFDEYVVTATRVPVKKSEVAANVTVIGNEEIEKGGYSKISDVLTANNVNMGTSSYASFPILNGDDRVLVLVDGRKMTWAYYSTTGSFNGLNIDNIAIENIERIEIVRGPNSALYGSDAVGGVINIITKKAKENVTKATTEFGSWNSRRYALTTEGVDNDISYIFTYDKQTRGNFDYKNPRTGHSREFKGSEIDKEHQTLRIDKQLDADSELSLSIERMEDRGGYGLALKDVDAGTISNPDERRHVSDLNVALTYSWGKEKNNANSFRIYQNTSEETAHWPYGILWHDLKVNGAEWQQSWQLDDNYTMIGGADIRQEKVNDFNSSKYMKAEATTKAVFIENNLKLKDDMSLNFGSRYDHHDTFGGEVTSHVSLSKEVATDTNVYISWGQAVRNPRLLDLHANTPSWLGNKDLKPESSDTFTLGLDMKLDHKTTLQSSIYRSELEDAIVWKSGVVGNQGMWMNVNREKRQGMEINLQRQLSEQWKINVGYSYSKIEKQQGETDSYILDPLNSRPNGYSLGIQYSKDKLDAGITMLSGTGRDTRAYTSDSYFTLDMNIRYRAAKDTQVYLKGYNLTNQAYEVIGTSPEYYKVPGKYPMARRSFVIGVEKQF